jgi:hypothetical protein
LKTTPSKQTGNSDEGPFRLSVHSNWPIRTSQLWPPLWKKQGLEGPKVSLKSKLAKAARAKAEKLAAKAGEAAAKAKAKAKSAAMKHTDWVDEDKYNAEMEKKANTAKLAKQMEEDKPDAQEEQLRVAKTMKSQWREKSQPDGTKYWYNKTTSVSTFDKPEGFLNKKDIRLLEIAVDQERTRKRVERGARRGSGDKGGDSSEDD